MFCFYLFFDIETLISLKKFIEFRGLLIAQLAKYKITEALVYFSLTEGYSFIVIKLLTTFWIVKHRTYVLTLFLYKVEL